MIIQSQFYSTDQVVLHVYDEIQIQICWFQINCHLALSFSEFTMISEKNEFKTIKEGEYVLYCLSRLLL